MTGTFEEPSAAAKVEGSDAVARLQRWEDSGAVWRVVGSSDAGVTVALCRCDGGEEVERFRSPDPELITFLDGRSSSEEATVPSRVEDTLPQQKGRTSVNRERDEQGRARNARPRDELGRPLPRGAVGVPRVPDDLVLPPLPALAEAQRLIDEGLPFHAHEVLEGTWKAAPPAERDLWQGLAQLAVGFTHLLRGNATGATVLLRRGQGRITPYAADPPYGIDIAGLASWAESAVTELAAGTAAERVTPPRLRGTGTTAPTP